MPRAALLACGLVALLAVPGTAQRAPAGGGPGDLLQEEPPASPARLDVIGFGGLLAPLSDLTEDPNSFGTVLTAAPALGAEAIVWLGAGLGAVVRGLWAPADLQIRPSDFSGAVPTELGGADWLAGTAGVRYRLRLSGAARIVEPYLGIGAGLRRLDVDPQAGPEVEDATDLVGTLGAGAQVRIAPAWGVRLEVRDYLSSFESPSTGEARMQNDLAISVGAVLRLR